MTDLFSHPYIYTAGLYSLTTAAIVFSLVIFELVTKYQTWEEIKRGNVAVALASSGKIFGIANIFRYSIEANDSVIDMLGWGLFGFLLLLLVYFIYEFLTPAFNVDEELAAGNRAAGLISFVLSVSLSFVIGATI
ncbi:DUF350 domain-containing protein [Alkalicoccus luteus]|uniref:DUF350 domain-containing protein n=1 Tax=Alkalicoccus luteus TaxID=1237094 RepID=A0A969TTW0_9BACI|nr:DUF350 domain-containing protein [Alkalicoccus luteus]NJP36700.1 DUF350 domain-containing protein [Alkalicoccus luteus]